MTNQKYTRKTTTSSSALYFITLSSAGLAVLTSGLLTFNLFRLNLLPLNYLLILISLLCIPLIFFVLFAIFKRTKRPVRIFIIVLSMLWAGLNLFAFFKTNDLVKFLNHNLGATLNLDTYYVLVSTESPYTTSTQLKNRSLTAFRDLSINAETLAEQLTAKTGAKISFEPDLLGLIDSALADSEKIIVINSETYAAFLEENPNYANRLKKLLTIELSSAVESSLASNDLTNTIFAVYISGIDTRSGSMPSRSLSDVNIVAIVNPLKHKLLLVAIPRDYYVHLPGTSSDTLSDKLTHTGTIGGVQLSKATISELLDLEIPYYVRVNFNFVENLVDAVGGITLYSDVDYSFSCWTDKNCIFYPGDNFVNGTCALAFARERHAYSSGDRHRGENQEQVISRILEKLTSSTTLLSRSSDILASLNGTFETNLETDDIANFIKSQLSDLRGWTTESQNLNGTTGGAHTYSYRTQTLSVMYPDEQSITDTKAKIASYLNDY